MGEKKIVIRNLDLGTNHEAVAVVITCVDLRLPPSLGGLYEYMIEKGFMPPVDNPRSAESIIYLLQHIDYLPHFGGGRVWTKGGHTQETVLAQTQLGAALHKAGRLIIISHSTCGASIHNGEEPKNGDWETMKCAELEKAREVAKQAGVPVHTLYIDHAARTMTEV